MFKIGSNTTKNTTAVVSQCFQQNWNSSHPIETVVKCFSRVKTTTLLQVCTFVSVKEDWVRPSISLLAHLYERCPSKDLKQNKDLGCNWNITAVGVQPSAVNDVSYGHLTKAQGFYSALVMPCWANDSMEKMIRTAVKCQTTEEAFGFLIMYCNIPLYIKMLACPNVLVPFTTDLLGA